MTFFGCIFKISLLQVEVENIVVMVSILNTHYIRIVLVMTINNNFENLINFIDFTSFYYKVFITKKIFCLDAVTPPEKCPYLEFFWSIISRIRAEYGEILHAVSVTYPIYASVSIYFNAFQYSAMSVQKQPLEVFRKKGVLKDFANFTVKQV